MGGFGSGKCFEKDQTTKMPRAPLSPRGGWTTGCGTFDTAYLDDDNA
jgi:hypothetical protein